MGWVIKEMKRLVIKAIMESMKYISRISDAIGDKCNFKVKLSQYNVKESPYCIRFQ